MPRPTTESPALTELTTVITEAYVANNRLAPDQVPQFIRGVHGSLKGVLDGGHENAPARKPAVPVKKSVRRDHVVCLECGRTLQSLKRHIRTFHDLTPEQYRERWQLAADHPLVAPNYAAKRSRLAKKIGLGHKRAR